jgi:hypothetical protein
MTDHYVGDGETLPTTPEAAMDLLAGFVGLFEQRDDIDEALTILDRFVEARSESPSSPPEEITLRRGDAAQLKGATNEAQQD